MHNGICTLVYAIWRVEIVGRRVARNSSGVGQVFAQVRTEDVVKEQGIAAWL